VHLSGVRLKREHYLLIKLEISRGHWRIGMTEGNHLDYMSGWRLKKGRGGKNLEKIDID